MVYKRVVFTMDRYQRQISLPEIGAQGQTQLKQTRILCVGAGGLGSPALLYLAAAGIGELGIIDGDTVELSNLQRQVLFNTRDNGKHKSHVAKDRLQALNSDVTIQCYPERLSPKNAIQVMENYDIILDGTDNFASKFLINDAAVQLDLPVVYGSISQFEGRASVFWAKKGPCYRCLYATLPKTAIQNCAEAGVLGAVAGIIGCIQATEAIKLALHLQPRTESFQQVASLKPLIGNLLILDAKTMHIENFKISKQPSCAVCSQHPTITSLDEANYPDCCALDIPLPIDFELNVHEISNRGHVELIDVRESNEWKLEHIPGAQNIPLSSLTSQSELTLDPEKKYVLYCQSGKRSQQAAKIMIQKGFNHLQHISGGMIQWKIFNSKSEYSIHEMLEQNPTP